MIRQISFTQGVLVCFAYVVTARLGLEFHSINGVAALIWPPTAIAFASCLIFGLRVWPAILIGGTLINLFSGLPVLAIAGMAVANSIEPLIAWAFCVRGPWGDSEFDRSLHRRSDAIRLIVGAGILSTLASATIGVGSLWMTGAVSTERFENAWMQWWAGNVLANLAITPLILVFSRREPLKRFSFESSSLIEKVAFVSLLLGMSILTFGNFSFIDKVIGFKGVYILSPLTLWGAMRFGQRGAALATFTFAVTATYFLADGIGPFAKSSGTASLLHLLVFVVIFAIKALFVGSVVTERETERENLQKRELEVSLAKHAADAANLAKSAFLANMSHEIRTPLGAVIGFSDLVVDPEIPVAEKQNYVAAIRRNGALVSSLINDILDLSKIEAGKMEANLRPTPLSEILTDTKTLLNLQAQEKGITLNITSLTSLPEVIETDALRLRQILINIIGNAIKFTERGSVDVTIRHEDGRLAFTVKDSGKGIRPEDARRLFAPFSQVDNSSKRKHGGAGLGLILSKRLANLLGGDVVLAHSDPTQGSTFLITINPGSIDSSAIVPTQSKSGPAKTAERLDGLRVLLTDDAPDNQLLVSRLLKLAGAEVDIASNGREAVEKALAREYDVLLMDLQMPVMDGYEATRELRNHGYPGTIIALTAHALKEERERCMVSGFDDHLSKPINRSSLVHRLAEI